MWLRGATGAAPLPAAGGDGGGGGRASCPGPRGSLLADKGARLSLPLTTGWEFSIITANDKPHGRPRWPGGSVLPSSEQPGRGVFPEASGLGSGTASPTISKPGGRPATSTRRSPSLSLRIAPVLGEPSTVYRSPSPCQAHVCPADVRPFSDAKPTPEKSPGAQEAHGDSRLCLLGGAVNTKLLGSRKPSKQRVRGLVPRRPGLSGTGDSWTPGPPRLPPRHPRRVLPVAESWRAQAVSSSTYQGTLGLFPGFLASTNKAVITLKNKNTQGLWSPAVHGASPSLHSQRHAAGGVVGQATEGARKWTTTPQPRAPARGVRRAHGRPRAQGQRPPTLFPVASGSWVWGRVALPHSGSQPSRPPAVGYGPRAATDGAQPPRTLCDPRDTGTWRSLG